MNAIFKNIFGFQWLRLVIGSASCWFHRDISIISHRFPNLGIDSKIIVNWEITPPSTVFSQNTKAEKAPNPRDSGVETKCLGLMFIELHKNVLHLRWEPGEHIDNFIKFGQFGPNGPLFRMPNRTNPLDPNK